MTPQFAAVILGAALILAIIVVVLRQVQIRVDRGVTRAKYSMPLPTWGDYYRGDLSRRMDKAIGTKRKRKQF